MELFSIENPNFQKEEDFNSNKNSTNYINGVADDVKNLDKRCGWFCFKPNCLQKFRTPKWLLFWLCWAGAIQGMLVNGFVNIVITTIERRFGLSSFQTGLIAGGYDIASFLCLVPVTYLGGRMKASKSRWIGFGILVMAVGALVFALPHFLAGSYKGAATVPNVCQRIGDASLFQGECHKGDRDPNKDGDLSENIAMWLFFTGQVLHGAGAAPLFTLGVTYIDENISKKMSSVYIGIYYTTAILGPAVGYVLGGQLLHIYTDFLTVDATELGLTISNNVWIGAWWLGFVITAIICVIISIPILAFPTSLPGASELRKERESEAHGEDATSPRVAFTKIKEIPKAFKALIVNPTFFFLNMAGASEGLLIAGFAAFLPKIIENQFSINASWAAVLMGIITIPAGGGGTYIGGYLVKKYKLKCSGIIKLCVYATVASAIFTVSFFLSCPNLPFAGVNQFYNNNSNHLTKIRSVSLSDTCNNHCSCVRSKYEPVCGTNNVMYYSPCHAGCKKERTKGDSKVYTNCSCIKEIKTPFFDETSYDAINTICKSECDLMWPFVALSFGTLFFTFLSTMPALTATLRCVRDDQRSFALGIQWIKVRLLGTIPAPIIFGSLIDKTCILWYNSCDEIGACLVYDNANMSRYMLGLAFIGKALSLSFFFLSYWFYKPPVQYIKNNET